MMFNRRVRSTAFILFIAILCIVAISTSNARAEQATATGPKITIFGSSVASGVAADDNKGYWYSLKELMEPRGWQVTCCSRGGDRTSRILDRFDDLLSHRPDYVIIGLSLANEGIKGKDEAGRKEIFDQYKWGIQSIIALLRDRNIEPIVGLCYPNGTYTPAEIEAIRRMNLLTNTWDVPCINFLGALDDTSGGWVTGYEADPWHPNDAGHKEMFYAIVPTLFDAIKAGKTTPKKTTSDGFVTLGGTDGQIAFKPQDTIHSWAMNIWIRNAKRAQTLATVGPNTIVIDSAGRVSYRSGYDAALLSSVNLNDGHWHNLIVSHTYALGQTTLYVDGQPIGTINEQLAPDSFTVGSDEATADFKEWLVYRSSLNQLEVQSLNQGELLQASLEIYAPLTDGPFKNRRPVENLAQSMSQAIYQQ